MFRLRAGQHPRRRRQINPSTAGSCGHQAHHLILDDLDLDRRAPTAPRPPTDPDPDPDHGDPQALTRPQAMAPQARTRHRRPARKGHPGHRSRGRAEGCNSFSCYTRRKAGTGHKRPESVTSCNSFSLRFGSFSCVSVQFGAIGHPPGFSHKPLIYSVL